MPRRMRDDERSANDELNELRAYRDTHERCRRDLSLWILEMENQHAAFGVMLERLRLAIAPI